MDRTTVGVRGTSVEKLSEELYDELRQSGESDGEATRVQLGGSMYGGSDRRDGASVVRHSGDEFDVLVTERYYLRTDSDLQTTIVVEQVAADRASVPVLTGGGATGLGPLSWDLGSESAQTGSLVSTLETVCDRLELALDPDGG